METEEITVDLLYRQKLIQELDRPVKILGNGELTKALNVKAHAFSRTAKEKIEKNKGKAEVIGRA
jgi:large subunit ribosomal protein L15